VLEQPIWVSDDGRSTRFFVKKTGSLKEKEEERVLSVSEEGLSLLHPFTEEVLEEYKLSLIKSWDIFDKQLVIVYYFPQPDEEVKIQFKMANQGDEFHNTINSYIEKAVSKSTEMEQQKENKKQQQNSTSSSSHQSLEEKKKSRRSAPSQTKQLVSLID